MKQLFLLSIAILLFISCNKTSTSTIDSNAGKTFEYIVLCSKGTWSGEYVDERSDETLVVNSGSGWSYSGTIPSTGMQASILFSSDLNDSTTICIGTIYVDGKPVKADTVKNDGYGNFPSQGQLNYSLY